jgi:hypothetical protein
MRLILAMLLLVPAAAAQTYERPFASNSYWNTPIQDGAELVSATADIFSDYFIVFEEYVVNKSLAADTLRDVREKTSETYCTTNVTANVHYQMRIPDAYTNTTKGDGNGISSFVEIDNATAPGRIREGYMFQRCSASGVAAQQFAGNHGNGQQVNIDGFNIYGLGRTLTASAATAWEAGTLGGIIRAGELVTAAGTNIDHTLRIQVDDRFLYTDGSRGYRWPAYNEDGDHATQYNSTEDDSRLGSLWTLARGTSPDSIGIETEMGRKLFWAFYNYGAYTVDRFPGVSHGFQTMGFTIAKSYSGAGGDTVEEEVLAAYTVSLNDAGGGPYDNPQTQDFHEDCVRLFRNAVIVVNASQEWPKGPPVGEKARLKNAGLSLSRAAGAQLLQIGGRANPTQL